MGKEKCFVKVLRQNPDGTKLAKIRRAEVLICPSGKHPDKFADPRIPGYHETPWPDGCINCRFRHDNPGIKELVCGLTLNDKGYFSGVSPLGKCGKYEKGKSLFP